MFGRAGFALVRERVPLAVTDAGVTAGFTPPGEIDGDTLSGPLSAAHALPESVTGRTSDLREAQLWPAVWCDDRTARPTSVAAIVCHAASAPGPSGPDASRSSAGILTGGAGREFLRAEATGRVQAAGVSGGV